MNTTLDLINVTAVVEPTTAPVTVIETTTINDAPDLEQLVKQILALQSDIESCSLISSIQGKRGLELAIKNGGKLLECQKEVECQHRRKWKQWCKKNITTIQYETVRHYIRLWEFDLVEHDTLMKCESIREAYYLVGIFKSKQIEEKTEKVKGDNSKVEPSEPREEPKPILEMPFDAVKTLELKLRTIFINNPTISYYGEMITMLKPLVNLYNEYKEQHPDESNRFTHDESITNN